MDGDSMVRRASPADGGRQRRGRILTALGVSVALLLWGGNSVIDRRVDARVESLRGELQETFAGTTSDDLLTRGQPVADNQMYLGVPSKGELTTVGGVAPDLITADGRTVQARYVVGSIGGGRCVVATWTEATFAVADGTDRQCAGGALVLD